MSRTILKIAVGAVAIAVLGFLFVRSARNVQSTAYTVAASELTPWTLALESPSSPSGALLVLRPPQAMAKDLFSQIFSRMSESLTGPTPAAMPLVLRGELERGMSGSVTPDALLALAREAGLESTAPIPRCLVSRRISEPGLTRQMFVALFDFPAFQEFRQRIRQRLSSSPQADAAFDPLALSPVVLVASTDANFDSWYPIRVQPESDCLAPLTVQ
jgi:hypothetical protein